MQLVLQAALYRFKQQSQQINPQQTAHLKLIETDEKYTCGVPLVDDKGHYFRNSLVVRRSLICQSAIETTYYSAKATLPAAFSFLLLRKQLWEQSL